jgi:hypothetical protein
VRARPRDGPAAEWHGISRITAAACATLSRDEGRETARSGQALLVFGVLSAPLLFEVEHLTHGVLREQFLGRRL